MGLDLALIPDQYERPETMGILATCRVPLWRDYRLFEQIKKLEPKRLPSSVQFTNYEDEGVKQRADDAYRKPLTFLRAGEFCAVDTTCCGAWNKAAIAFIRRLPPETMIVLFWH